MEAEIETRKEQNSFVSQKPKVSVKLQNKREETEKQQFKYIYLYGIINKKNAKLNIRGLKNKPIEEINFKDVSALTSSYSILNPKLNDEEAVQHADILKEIAKKTTVVPTSFGTVFKDDEILETILSSSYLAIKQTLALIEGKIELGVKVIKQKESEIPMDLKNKSGSNNQSGEAPNGTALEILGSLDKLSVKSAKGDNFSDRLLLNHSFLVEKNQFSKFSNEIAKLEKKHKDLRFLYTGPWPPYSFVNINIKGS